MVRVLVLVVFASLSGCSTWDSLQRCLPAVVAGAAGFVGCLGESVVRDVTFAGAAEKQVPMDVKIKEESGGVVAWELRQGARILHGVIRVSGVDTRIFVNGMKLRIGNPVDDRWISAQVRRTLSQSEIEAITNAWLDSEVADDGARPGLVDG